MLEFKETNNHIFVRTPYEMKMQVQLDLNGTWSKKENAYRFPKNLHCMRELINLFPQLKLNTDFMELGKRLNAAREQALNLKQQADALGDSRLRCYQRADVQYLKTLPAALIANEPRTGKTPTSIILMKELGKNENLVIAPASLILNWAKEIQTWWPDCGVFTVKGTPTKREAIYKEYNHWCGGNNPSVLVISKDTWKSDHNQFAKYEFDTVFVDEAHYLRNYDTAQSKAIYAIKAKRRYALTGTPTIKSPTDVFGILKFLYPTRFTSFWQFVERYFEQQKDFWGHQQIGDVKPHRKAELQEMIGFIGVQRKRSEVMNWLPEKQYITQYCEMEMKQAKLYKQMAEDFCAKLEGDDHVVDTPNVLSQLMRLRQLCQDPRLLGFDVVGTKTKGLLEWLDNNREPVVIMSMFTSYLELLKPDMEKLGLKVGEINGRCTLADKESAKTDFQQGKTDILLCNTISAGVGFTLDRASICLFTDLPFNYSELSQAEDRILPTTREKYHPVTIQYFTVKDTVDERITEILTNKKSLTDILNNGGRDAIQRLFH